MKTLPTLPQGPILKSPSQANVPKNWADGFFEERESKDAPPTTNIERFNASNRPWKVDDRNGTTRLTPLGYMQYGYLKLMTPVAEWMEQLPNQANLKLNKAQASARVMGLNTAQSLASGAYVSLDFLGRITYKGVEVCYDAALETAKNSKALAQNAHDFFQHEHEGFARKREVISVIGGVIGIIGIVGYFDGSFRQMRHNWNESVVLSPVTPLDRTVVEEEQAPNNQTVSMKNLCAMVPSSCERVARELRDNGITVVRPSVEATDVLQLPPSPQIASSISESSQTDYLPNPPDATPKIPPQKTLKNQDVMTPKPVLIAQANPRQTSAPVALRAATSLSQRAPVTKTAAEQRNETLIRQAKRAEAQKPIQPPQNVARVAPVRVIPPSSKSGGEWKAEVRRPSNWKNQVFEAANGRYGG